jgi:hypothetical protein
MGFTFVLVVALSLSVAQTPSLLSVLARAGDFAAAFHHDSRQLASDESYVQTFDGNGPPRQMVKSLRSEFVMVADEAGATWYGFRDVLEVNGKALPKNTRGRLERVLRGSPEASIREARRISEEGAQHVLAGPGRAVNTPTMALMILLPAHQARFAFSKRGEQRVGSATVWVISFREIHGPMFFRAVDGREVPMTGEFWIEPHSGRVFRAQFVVDSVEALRDTSGRPDQPRLLATVDFSRMNVEVTYGPDSTLDVFVPLEMKEIFSREVRMGGGGPMLDSPAATHYVSDRFSCVATYTNVRRVVMLEPGGVVSGR